MSTKKTGLGKGLDALIPLGESSLPKHGIAQLPIESIQPNPRQPRARFNSEELQELALSIQENGIIQPLIVTSGKLPGQYILIAGERRLLAARQAGLREIPAIVRDASEQQLIELALVENVQRADLSPLETAEAYRQLSEDFHLSHEGIAEKIGKSRVAVTNTLRLLKLPEDVKLALAEGRITEGHARALLAMSSDRGQSAALQTILRHDLNVRQTEELVRKLAGQRPTNPNKSEKAPEIKELEEQLREHLGTRVNVNPTRKGGTLVIHYYSEEELNSLISIILGE